MLDKPLRKLKGQRFGRLVVLDDYYKLMVRYYRRKHNMTIEQAIDKVRGK